MGESDRILRALNKEADRSLLHATLSMLSNRVAEQECPYVTKYARKKANVYCQSE